MMQPAQCSCTQSASMLKWLVLGWDFISHYCIQTMMQTLDITRRRNALSLNGIKAIKTNHCQQRNQTHKIFQPEELIAVKDCLYHAKNVLFSWLYITVMEKKIMPQKFEWAVETYLLKSNNSITKMNLWLNLLHKWWIYSWDCVHVKATPQIKHFNIFSNITVKREPHLTLTATCFPPHLSVVVPSPSVMTLPSKTNLLSEERSCF